MSDSPEARLAALAPAWPTDHGKQMLAVVGEMIGRADIGHVLQFLDALEGIGAEAAGTEPTARAWMCCEIGRKSTGAVHEGNCPYYLAVPRLSLMAALALPDDQWIEYRAQPELFGDPDPRTGRAIRWVAGDHDPSDDGGHLWGSDRGRYAFCARPRCRLVYSMWDGDPCPDPAPHVSTDLVPVQLPDDVLTTALSDARAAIVAGRGVGLWTIVQQLRADGHGDAADGITRELVERAITAAQRDPELFAQLLGALRASPGTE